MIPPSALLAVLLGVTLVALVLESMRARRQAEAIRRFAAGQRLNFGWRDALKLTERVARHFPVPGVASLHVSNVAYGVDGDEYLYLFTVRYTLGITGPRQTLVRAARYTEPRDRRSNGVPTLQLADEELPLVEQYEALVNENEG